MATYRVDSEDFREFIDWLIAEAHVPDLWSEIRRVYEKPWHFGVEYEEFQEATYPPDEV